MARKELIKAVAYFRTSSMTNVGEDTDTIKRQRSAVEGFAKRAGYEIVAEYSDDGVKGADPVDSSAWLCRDAATRRRQWRAHCDRRDGLPLRPRSDHARDRLALPSRRWDHAHCGRQPRRVPRQYVRLRS